MLPNTILYAIPKYAMFFFGITKFEYLMLQNIIYYSISKYAIFGNTKYVTLLSFTEMSNFMQKVLVC